MVTVNIIFDFGSTQKWAKSDAPLSVGAFGGVRNGHRTRASGDVLFFHIVKYTSNWPASRRARPSTHYMPPAMIIDDFERFLHPWREQSNTWNDKNERIFMHFRRSSDGVCLLPLQHRASYFSWSLRNEFSTIFSDFGIHGVSKATPGTTKANAF